MEGIYKVKTEVFEGPLDLLLSLIEKRKLFINEISLAKIADDFVGYIQGHEKFPIAQSADFLVVASTLLLIKSRSLLPDLALTPEEQTDISDLERRLKILERIKALSAHIKETYGEKPIYALEARKAMVVFSPDASMTATNLWQAFTGVLRALPKIENIPKAVVKKVISLEEMIGNLTTRIQSAIKLSFRDFAKVGKTEKVNVIISFLAMLELVKQGVVDVRQDNNFDDIQMETQVVGVPRYN